MNSFLPIGYESLKTEKAYWKMGQMKEGDNRLRIVTQPIAGWLDWHDGKPVRTRPDNKPKESFDPAKPVRAFWTCYVWDYVREGLYILEITQTSIIKSLVSLATSDDWGDFTKYDVKINKQGSGKETRYLLTPVPPKPISEKIVVAWESNPVRLEALYEGRDPWTDFEPLDIVPVVQAERVDELGPLVSQLQESLELVGVPLDDLGEYIESLVKKSGKSTLEVVKQALLRQQKFHEAYLNYIAESSSHRATA